ncbi:hypothetical protein ASPWEDRAFT_38926 [Aspergillus wentii DTO 134E9]|uniref:Uncharacterized protein n=1 Tax=Aspergillus wentii DTO 134E9 TaxID=1073089 RepID=A0A1L9RQN9_ASPWE|nr:uncharacterized protein ASPWEDRAFT_38926 [Aspergillus wentii DTO 134E9]OJJ37249.1 hypothetical protein ASPWEDRAFT_38926 [Aspergillus wentii DTO 134E9]
MCLARIAQPQHRLLLALFFLFLLFTSPSDKISIGRIGLILTITSIDPSFLHHKPS